MSKLNKLISACKMSVHINVNEHKGCHSTVKQDLYESARLPVDDTYIRELLSELGLTKDIFDKMVELDSIVYIQFYPRTTNGSYTVYHYDTDKALDQCLDIIISLMENK